MDKRDDTSGLTEQEYRDGLHLAQLAEHNGWPVFKTFCDLYVNDNKEIVFNNTNVEKQLSDDYYRGCGKGVEELLLILNTRIELALRQQKKETDENSAEEKEN